MAGDGQTTLTIEELIASGAIIAHKDGNYGSNYPRVEEFGTEGVPFLTAKSLRDGYVDIAGAPRLGDARADELTFGFVQTDDVLLSHNATIGRVAIVPQHRGKLLVGTSLTYFRLNPKKLLPRYLAVYLAGADFQNQLVAVMSHSTRNQVPVSAQRKLHVVVPPLAEQKAIAAVLGALDDKIELNRRMNATLEAMARALFQSWFVDFDPVRTKLDGSQPSGLDKATAALFPEHLEDSPLGHIPKGWEVKSADEVSTVGIGKTPPRMEYHWFSENPADVPWMSIRDLGNAGVFISHTAECLTTEAVERFRVKRIPDNTVVLSFKLTMGRVAITDGEMLSNEAIAHFRLNPDTAFGSAYLYCYLKGFGFDQLGSTSSIATAINSDMVRGMRILVPPKGISDVFERTVKPLFTQMKTIQKQSRTLATLRDTLLPRLLSGELNGVRPNGEEEAVL